MSRAAEMNGNAKRIARLSLLTAMGAVLLILANVIPAGRLVLLAAASFPVCAALMMHGRLWSLGVFVVTAALAAIIMPGTASIAYAAFFGYYPILKSILENIHGNKRVWILKYVLYTLVFILYVILVKTTLVTVGEELRFPWVILYIVGAAAFFVYDRCYSVLIRFYIEKIARYFP